MSMYIFNTFLSLEDKRHPYNGKLGSNGFDT
jgi:hypothetical protein